jgi:DNA repair exonuclease SbcCD ATPase subunit
MKLRSLDLQKLPGIQPPFRIDDIPDGVTVIVGPNASGKSSLMRALRAALYEGEQRHALLHIEATFEDERGGLNAVRFGRELKWQRGGQPVERPVLPEHRFLSCFTLRVEDLLSVNDPNATDEKIAERLATALAGGYDLPTIRANPRFRPKPARGRGERQEFIKAKSALRKTQGNQNELRQQEARLDSLRSDKEAAARAEREAAVYKKALSFLDASRERVRLEARLAEFPVDMERLRGDENSRLETLANELEEQKEAREAAENRRAEAEVVLDESGLAGADLHEADFADWRQQIGQLRQTETAIAQQQAALQAAQSDRKRAHELLGGVDEQRLPRLQSKTIHQIEQKLVDKRRLDAEVYRLKRNIEDCAGGASGSDTPDAIRQARAELTRWLSAPRDASGGARLGAGAMAFVAGAAGIIAAAIIAHWAYALLLIPLAAGTAWVHRGGKAGAGERHGSRSRFLETKLDGPQQWNSEAVRARLRELDDALQRAEQAAAAAERCEMDERRLAGREEELQEVRDALAEVAADVGYDPERLDASLERWTKLVADYDRADVATNKAQAALKKLASDADASRKALVDFLESHAEAPSTEHPDADAFGVRLDRLADRLRQRDTAKKDKTRARADEKKSSEAAKRIQQQIRQIYSDAGLNERDDAALRQRLDGHAAWKKLSEELRDARSIEGERLQPVREREDLIRLVEQDDQAALQQTLDDLEDVAAEQESVAKEINKIETEVAIAGRQRALEEARGQQQRVADVLTDRLNEELFARATSHLLDQVEAEHIKTSQPAALRRASDWFKRFTHFEYELTFDPDGQNSFAARDLACDKRRGLSELSSGTRMQLLLAVRIAFALEAERGCEPLPLLLDEALTTADPERFTAIVESLRTVADDGERQIFYLTAQPADIGYWKAAGAGAHYIDLAQLRQTDTAIKNPSDIKIPERPDIPSPDGQSPEAYAFALRVPAIDPWAPDVAIHVFYLLRDDLDLLHKLAALGIEKIGAIQALLSSDLAQILLDEPVRQKLAARITAARAWLQAWRQGRGRPVDRQALFDSGAVSDKFMDEVCVVAQEVGGDARALIERLADRAVSGFYTSKRDELQEWFLEHGYLDQRDRLAENEIGWRVRAALDRQFADESVALDEAQALSVSLSSGLKARAECEPVEQTA